MRIRHLCVVTAIAALAALPAVAKPNFSGQWKANVSKSDFGQMPAPDKMEMKIGHEDPKLEVHNSQAGQFGEMEWDAKYTTDGQESKNVIRDNPATSIVKWDGDVLKFDTKGKFGDNDFTMTDKWSLSEDGKTVTMERHFSSSFGEGDQKVVMEKQ
jgi:predicted lipoprotein